LGPLEVFQSNKTTVQEPKWFRTDPCDKEIVTFKQKEKTFCLSVFQKVVTSHQMLVELPFFKYSWT